MTLEPASRRFAGHVDHVAIVTVREGSHRVGDTQPAGVGGGAGAVAPAPVPGCPELVSNQLLPGTPLTFAVRTVHVDCWIRRGTVFNRRGADRSGT